MAAAAIAELAGADGITIHLREDRRHIQDRDLRLLRQTIKTRLNLEMAATDEMVSIALSVKPDMCTLVPEKRQELTTEGGLDVRLHLDAVKGAVQKLQDGGSSSASSSTRTPIRSRPPTRAAPITSRYIPALLPRRPIGKQSRKS